MDVAQFITPAALAALVEILMIDIVLAGDNAIVVGALAAGLPADQRKKVIAIGVLAALMLRIAFALVVSQLLQIVGLILAGMLLGAGAATYWISHFAPQMRHSAVKTAGVP